MALMVTRINIDLSLNPTLIPQSHLHILSKLEVSSFILPLGLQDNTVMICVVPHFPWVSEEVWAWRVEGDRSGPWIAWERFPKDTMCLVLSRVCLFAIPWTVASQAPLSMGFHRQQYWSGLPFPSPGDLPDWGSKPASPVSPALLILIPAEPSSESAEDTWRAAREEEAQRYGRKGIEENI